jgi:hypothetical protein
VILNLEFSTLSCLGSFRLEINCDRIWPAYVEAVVGAFKIIVKTPK